MASDKSHRRVDIMAGIACLVSAALNWWNKYGVGFTIWRILPAIVITLIGLWLLNRAYRVSGSEESEDDT